MDHVWNLGQNGFLYQDLHSRKSILLHQVVVLTTVSGKKKIPFSQGLQICEHNLRYLVNAKTGPM